jgi:hypothetical protein
MSNRNQLPNRRPQLTYDVLHDGQLCIVSVGWKENLFEGGPQEAFIHTDNKRSSSAVESILRDAAILISLALQHGTPLTVLKEAVTRDDHGNPATPIGAVLDSIARIENEVAP